MILPEARVFSKSSGLGLVNNASLLLALTVFYEIIPAQQSKRSRWLELMYTQYRVIEFHNAEEALEMSKIQPPALNILDIDLPE